MSIKTTNKEVTRNYLTFQCGYCSAQNILKYENVTAHTEGIYGWNSDIYTYGITAISTGYRPVGISGYQEIIEKYDRQARDNNYSREQSEKMVQLMFGELLAEWRKRTGN